MRSTDLKLCISCASSAVQTVLQGLQTRLLVREDALERRNKYLSAKKEEQYKIWSRVPKGGPIPRRTVRLTVGRKKNSNSKDNGAHLP
jgi:hypothetical protein